MEKNNKNKKQIIIIFATIVILTLSFIFFSMNSMQFLEKENTKIKISDLMKKLNYTSIQFSNGDDLNNDNILKIVNISSGEDNFKVYLYNKNEIYSIVNSSNNKEIYSNKKKFLKNKNDEDVIILVQGIFGAYGKINVFDKGAKLKYYLPQGKYKFRKLDIKSLNSKDYPTVYLQKSNNTNGITQEETIKEISFKNNLFIEIEITEDTYLDLSKQSILEVQKIN